MSTPGVQAFVAATGPYGLVGRGLFGVFPGLAPLDLIPPPAELLPRLLPGTPAEPADITNLKRIAGSVRALSALAAGRPLVVIHLAALTDTKSGEEEPFRRVNVAGTENILRAVEDAGGRLIHISTDYVFAGEDRVGAPYRESDRPRKRPAGPYASTKFDAENLVLDKSPSACVARIAFPYAGEGNRPGLAEKFLERFESSRHGGPPARLFNDQRTCPSYVPDIHRGLRALVDAIVAGRLGGRRVFHLSGAETTPYDFGALLRRLFRYEDVGLEASSVRGTTLASNLALSHEETSRALGWTPLSHEEALKEWGARRAAKTAVS